MHLRVAVYTTASRQIQNSGEHYDRPWKNMQNRRIWLDTNKIHVERKSQVIILIMNPKIWSVPVDHERFRIICISKHQWDARTWYISWCVTADDWHGSHHLAALRICIDISFAGKISRRRVWGSILISKAIEYAHMIHCIMCDKLLFWHFTSRCGHGHKWYVPQWK